MQVLEKNPSFAWRSILAAQALVKKGRRWQVGNGHGIMIWKDKWLPCPSTYEIVSPVSSLPGNSQVATLIDDVNGAWKTDLVWQVFLPHEADIICGIALSTNLLDDKQVWASTTNGLFSVRSAYKLAMEMSLGAPVGDVSDGSHLRKFWKYLWSCNIPYKIRHLLGGLAKMCCPWKRTWSGVKYSWIVAVMSVTWRKKIWAIFFGVVNKLVKSCACLTCFETHWFNTLGHSWICYGM